MFLDRIRKFRKVHAYAKRFCVSYRFASLSYDIEGQRNRGEISNGEYTLKVKALKTLFPNELSKCETKVVVNGAELKNACTITAIRNLLDDQSWAPPEYVEYVKNIDRNMGGQYRIIQKYAPVKFFVGEEEARLVIKKISPETKVCISYFVSGTECHMECIRAKDFSRYSRDKVRSVVIKV